jgi:hypothetical protein
MRPGPAPDPHAVRAPSGAKSRSRHAQMVALFCTPTAQARAAWFRRQGMAPDAAAVAALHPLAGRTIGQLRLANLITGAQWSAARMLETAWHDLTGPGLTAAQSALASFAEYGARIDRGRRVAARVEADADDERMDPARGAVAPAVLWRGVGGGNTLFERTVREFATYGMTPNVAVTAARGAVQNECGNDAWRLLDALLMAGGPVPRNASLAMLRAALDTAGATLRPGRSGIGMSAHECHVLSRATVLAADFAAAP